MDVTETIATFIETSVSCDCVKKEIINIILMFVTWGLTTFDVVTDWLMWEETRTSLEFHRKHRIFICNYGFLAVAIIGSIFWILESILFLYKLQQLFKQCCKTNKKQGSTTEGLDQNKDKENTLNLIKDISRYDKARLTLNCCIVLIEDTPAIFFSLYLITERQVCFINATNGLLSTSNLINVMASLINSIWLLISSYITMCRCCCCVQNHCKEICYGQWCPYCISIENDCHMCLIIPQSFLSPVCWWMLPIFGRQKGRFARNMRKRFCCRYIINIIIFVIIMINLILGSVFYYAAINVVYNDYYHEDDIGGIINDFPPGLDERADGSIFLNHELIL